MADDADDHYAVLGVARSAAQAEIKGAYQTLAGKYHPDLHQQNPLAELAKERMIRINAAYELLADPVKRGIYDAGVRAWTQGRGARERRAQTTTRGWTARHTGRAILLIVLLPIAFRVTVMLVRGLRSLLGEAGAIGGGPVAAWVVIAGLVVLAVVWRKRRGRHGDGESNERFRGSGSGT